MRARWRSDYLPGLPSFTLLMRQTAGASLTDVNDTPGRALDGANPEREGYTLA